MAIITPKIQNWLNTRTEDVHDSLVKSEIGRIEKEKQEELINRLANNKFSDLPPSWDLRYNF